MVRLMEVDVFRSKDLEISLIYADFLGCGE